jgi:hypothetical protein
MKQTIRHIAIATIIVAGITFYSANYTHVAGSVAPLPTNTPTPTPMPECETKTPYDKEIEKVFWDQSCNAKRVLRWIRDGQVYGENTNFIVENADRVQKDGSVDRGLFRINSGTFNHYIHALPGLLHNNGIYVWDDMLDPVKNIRLAQIVYLYQGWCAWYAAPTDLCSRNYN